MTYRLEFAEAALKEWHRLDGAIRAQMKKKLVERLNAPRVPASRLRGSPERFKIKLRDSGYRLVYEVDDLTVTVFVVAVGRRDGGEVYQTAKRRS